MDNLTKHPNKESVRGSFWTNSSISLIFGEYEWTLMTLVLSKFDDKYSNNSFLKN